MTDPVVSVVMGSDSDWPVMRAAVEALAEFGVPVEADVVSAHRMPADMIAFGQAAAGRGIKVIIAGAGGAAHLPGMLASVTTLPVIGVPVPLAHLDGLDSLLSIVQMPAGIPVATVSVGGARNAGTAGGADPGRARRGPGGTGGRVPGSAPGHSPRQGRAPARVAPRLGALAQTLQNHPPRPATLAPGRDVSFIPGAELGRYALYAALKWMKRQRWRGCWASWPLGAPAEMRS